MNYRVTFDNAQDSITVDSISSDSVIYVPAPGQTVVLSDGMYVVTELPVLSYTKTPNGNTLQEATCRVVPLP